MLASRPLQVAQENANVNQKFNPNFPLASPHPTVISDQNFPPQLDSEATCDPTSKPSIAWDELVNTTAQKIKKVLNAKQRAFSINKEQK